MNREEQAVMLIVHGGYARSLALQAIEAAKEGRFDLAQQRQMEATAELNKANDFQKELITNSLCRGDESRQGITLMDIHGQDHYMNALTMLDLVDSFIELFKMRGGS